MARGGALVAATMAALAVVLVLCMAPEARAAVEFSDKDLATEDSAWALYELWIAHHKVARDGAEKTRRFRVFKDNLRRVHELHERDRSYKLAMNNFGDMTDGEVSAAYGCEDLADDGGGEDQDQGGGFSVPASGADDLPKTVDWRYPGYDQLPAAVTDVKDQGAFCECCWAFSAVASVEGLISIRRRILTTLSAQQLVDCDTMDKGCNGGLAARAFRYITNNGGLAGEASYPYMGLNHSCRKPMSPFVELNGLLRVKPYSEVDLRKAVAAQPVAVSVDPGRPGTAFKRYTGGIFQGPCGNNSSRRGHAMALIGYATDESGDDYWILKNSWSDEWGEDGYMRLKRDAKSSAPLGPAASCAVPFTP